jgi:hypothetical protein
LCDFPLLEFSFTFYVYVHFVLFKQHTEQEISRTEGLKEELQLSQCEVQSLKQLMYGKDYLVTQKTKALDLSKVTLFLYAPRHNKTNVLRLHPRSLISGSMLFAISLSTYNMVCK